MVLTATAVTLPGERPWQEARLLTVTIDYVEGEPMTNPSAFLAVLDAALPPERRQHGAVTRSTDTIADSSGGIGLPWRAEGLLARLERRGDIRAAERHAGDEFHRLFHLAHLDPLQAASLTRGERTQPVTPFGGDRARHRIAAAIDALGGHGSPCGSIAWHVLGCELSLRQWALREGWSGRPVSPHVAKGALVATLGVLAHHFGLRAERA